MGSQRRKIPWNKYIALAIPSATIVYLHKPINKYCPHARIEIFLYLLHIVHRRPSNFLKPEIRPEQMLKEK